MTPFLPLTLMLLLNAVAVTQSLSPEKRRPLDDEDARPKKKQKKPPEISLCKKKYVKVGDGSPTKSSFGKAIKAVDKETGQWVAITIIKDVDNKYSRDYLLIQKKVEFLKIFEGSDTMVNLICFQKNLKHQKVAIVTEYCASDLSGYMALDVNPWNEMKGAFVPFLSSAVQQMALKQVVHFDLNPTNIWRCGPVWKVANFGAAEIVNPGHAGTLSEFGIKEIHLTEYTDPRLRRNLYSFDSDMYSIGALLYLATGSQPLPHEPPPVKLDPFTTEMIETLLDQQKTTSVRSTFQKFILFAAHQVKICDEVFQRGDTLYIDPSADDRSTATWVYEAIRVSTQERVVVKVIKEASKGSDAYLQAKKEIDFLEKFKDSNTIVNMICSEAKKGTVVIEGTVVIVMEFCSMDLFAYLKGTSESKLSSNEVRTEIVPFLVNAVREMRSKNIVHFDLKPENILLCNSKWKVADFGGSEYVQDEQFVLVSPPRGSDGYFDPRVKQQGAIFSPVNPDVLVSGRYYFDSDLYSIGAILYVLVTGDHVETPYRLSKVDNDLSSFIRILLAQHFTFKEFYEYSEERITTRINLIDKFNAVEEGLP